MARAGTAAESSCPDLWTRRPTTGLHLLAKVEAVEVYDAETEHEQLLQRLDVSEQPLQQLQRNDFHDPSSAHLARGAAPIKIQVKVI